jgi:ATP-binding cassette, subfamily B, multidrug efflux pump
MARLVDVTSGAVVVDGVDIRDMEPNALWSRVGLVPQKPYLFSGTVASNMRYGKPDATDDEIWEALRVAQAADFVAAMPGGIEAPITDAVEAILAGRMSINQAVTALMSRPLKSETE